MSADPSTVWVLPDDSAPLRHVVEAYRDAHGPTDVLYWESAAEQPGSYGRSVTLRRSRDGYDLTVKAISPRLLWDLLRHPADVVVVLELDLAALYAVVAVALGRLRGRRRRVVALVESDLEAMGATGTAAWKMAFRRLVARGVDAFVANNAHAAAFLTRRVGVPADRVVEGWWLAGLPDDLVAEPPPAHALGDGEGPVFLAVGQLIERKGHDLLLRAARAHVDRHGPCRVWIMGTGPDREALGRLAADLGMADRVTFFGHATHAQLKGALEACDAFVFPTLGDLVGRALVETLSTGTPVVVSRHSGAIGTLVHDGRNGVVVDPRDVDDLLAGMRAVTAGDDAGALRQGAQRTMEEVRVSAAVAVVHRGIAGSSG